MAGIDFLSLWKRDINSQAKWFESEAEPPFPQKITLFPLKIAFWIISTASLISVLLALTSTLNTKVLWFCAKPLLFSVMIGALIMVHSWL